MPGGTSPYNPREQPFTFQQMNADRKCGSWLSILPIIVAFILLFVVFRGLDFRVLTQTFAQMRVWCFVSAVALYGLLFLPAAWRWHLVLRSSDAAVSFGATLRASLIGHFFYTTFFGVIGGDSAKAVLYADRFGFSPASILATAPLDRLLGSIGAILFALL